MKITQGMIRKAQGAMGCDPAECDECVSKALETVLSMPEVREAVLADMTDWELEQASVARRAEAE